MARNENVEGSAFELAGQSSDREVEFLGATRDQTKSASSVNSLLQPSLVCTAAPFKGM